MSDKTTMKFLVRDKGGKLGGHILQREVPDFDWEEFKRCPNAMEFARKAYFQALRRLIREVEEGSNLASSPSAISSLESVITRSLSYTKEEIRDWFNGRDWTQVTFKGEREKALKRVEECLTSPSTLFELMDPRRRNHLGEIVASVADKPSDAIADYLFSRITAKTDDLELDGL